MVQIPQGKESKGRSFSLKALFLVFTSFGSTVYLLNYLYSNKIQNSIELLLIFAITIINFYLLAIAQWCIDDLQEHIASRVKKDNKE